MDTSRGLVRSNGHVTIISVGRSIVNIVDEIYFKTNAQVAILFSTAFLTVHFRT
jgi:hypothetical protein